MAESLTEGTTLSRYRIVSRLGAGGMGEVYRAEDPALDRHIAIKVLPASVVTHEERIRRFVQEAKAASGLSHPNIVTIHGVGQAVPSRDGQGSGPAVHFIAMELVEGETLRGKIYGERHDLRAILRYLAQAADGLAKAHAAGIIHRDLKPDNIMVTRDGFAKVLDFGLAKLTEKNQSLETQVKTAVLREETREGTVLGTVGYMAPEQVEGKVVDARADIFSFGCILYEAITRQKPFLGKSDVDVMHNILHAEPVSISELAPDVPVELRRTVRRCLAKDPEQRYQSMKDLAIELRELAEEFHELTSGSGSRSVPAAVMTRRGPAPWMIAVAAAAIIAAVVIAAFLLLRRREVVAPAAEMKLTRITSHGNAGRATVSPDGRWVAYTRLEKGKTSIQLLQVATGSEVTVFPPTDERHADGFTFSRDGNYLYVTIGENSVRKHALYVVPTLGGSPRAILSDVFSPIAIAPDEKRFAFIRAIEANEEQQLVVARFDGGGEQMVLSKRGKEFLATEGLSWSPDGKWIATPAGSFAAGLGRTVLVVSPDGKQQKTLTNPNWFYIGGVTWLPDGSGLLTNGTPVEKPEIQVWLISFPDGKGRRITNDFNSYAPPTLTSDGKSLVSVQEERRQRLWKGSGQTFTPLTSEGDRNGPGIVALMPDGSVIYQSFQSGNPDVWRQMPNGERRQLTSHPRADYQAVPARDGSAIYFLTERNGPAEFWVMDPDGANQRSLRRIGTDVDFTVSPDNRWIVYSDANVLWRMPAAGGAPVKLADYRVDGAPQYSPDGKWLAGFFGKPNEIGRLSVMPADGGPIRDVAPVPTNANRFLVRWTRDGKALGYKRDDQGVDNIWLQPVAGGPATQLTHFDSALMTEFEWSHDGKELYLARSSPVSDVVLITDFR
jgi:eukaryotic-like serine/threonine-protein kinase